MINDKPLLPPLYGHYFFCLSKLIKSIAIRWVYLYLFNEYLIKSRKDESTTIPLSYSRIAVLSGVNRKYVTSYLDSLSHMGLISISNKGIRINAEVIYGLATAYRNIEKEQQEMFELALENGDYSTLRKLGYKERSAQSMLFLLSGSPYHDGNNEDVTNVTVATNVTNETNVADKSCDKCHKSEKNETNVALLTEEDYEIAELYAKIIATNVSKRKFRRDFLDLVATNVTNEMAEEFVEAIFATNVTTIRKFWPKFGHILVLLTCDICRTEPVTFVASGCDICRTVYKEENKIKNKVPQILKKFSRSQENFEDEEEQETSSFENFEESQEPDDKLPELDLNILAERNAQQYKYIKRKQNLPFLPEEDVRRWASNIRECLDRPDKLFLHYLYEIGHELFDKEEETDEEGNIISEASSSIDRWLCYEDRVVSDLLTPAMDSLMEAVKAGKVIVDGEELPVEIKEKDVDPSLVELLIDWDKVSSSLNQGSYLYIITPDKYKNIYAEEVPVVKKERNFEERKKKIDDNNTYLHKLILLAQWNDTYEQLTCLEKTVFNFADTFFQLDDNTLKPVDILKQSEMSQFRHTALKASLQRFKLTKLIEPLTWEDFTSVFYGTKIDMNECLYLETRMFDADLIRRYNALHNLRSIVDEQSLDELIEDYTGGNETSSQ